jgi:hypothetical protein
MARQSADQLHTEREDHPWVRNVAAHPKRSDSPEYKQTRPVMVKLAQLANKQPFVFGSGPWQDHHGGGVWLVKNGLPFLIKLPVGIEWSMQFCLDFEKVDLFCRATARVIVSAFPETIPLYESIGYPEGRANELLDTTIADSETLAHWVDGIFNASVPLGAADHTGVLPKAAGVHHYPTPVKDGEFIKRDDFELWVRDPESGKKVAVAPVDYRGSGDGRVAVEYAPPGTALHKKLRRANASGKVLIVPSSHPIAKRAFAHQ